MRERVITGLSLLGLGILTLSLGGLTLATWLFVVSLFICYELSTMLKKNNYPVIPQLNFLFTILIFFSFILPKSRSFWQHNPLAGLLIGFVVASFIYELIAGQAFLPKKTMSLAFRVSVTSSALLPFIFLLRESKPSGLAQVWYTFIVIWSTDVFALYAGKMVGKTPLSDLSPKKTVEGTIFGILGSLIMGSLAALCFGLSLWLYAPLAVVISVMSQIGDLHESLVKRQLRTKDSSQLLPGHGGFYDRADSSLFIFPILYYFFKIFA